MKRKVENWWNFMSTHPKSWEKQTWCGTGDSSLKSTYPLSPKTPD